MIFDLLIVLPLVWSDPPLVQESGGPPPALIANPPITLVQKAENGRLLRWPEPSHVAVQKLNLSPSVRKTVQGLIQVRDQEFDLYVDEHLDRLKEMVLKSSQGGEVSLGEAIDGWGAVAKRSSLVYELQDVLTPEQAKIALDAVRSYRTVLEEEVAADAGVELPPRALKIRATMATRSVRLRESLLRRLPNIPTFAKALQKLDLTQAQQQRMMQQLMPVLTAQDERSAKREREAVLACVALFSEEQVFEAIRMSPMPKVEPAPSAPSGADTRNTP
ncbi:MAG: hypothetical protein ACPGGL_03900 [Phycisphaerales bacterium]